MSDLSFPMAFSLQPSLNAVREAMRMGDREGAFDRLTELLRTEPSAEAWVLASQLTDNHDYAVRCCQRALMLDPYNGAALTQLSLLGASREAFVKTLGREAISAIIQDMTHPLGDVATTAPGVRRRRAIRLILSIVLMIVGVFTFYVLVRPDTDALPPGAPIPAQVNIYQANDVMQHFAASGLQLSQLRQESPIEGESKVRIGFTVRDENGTWHAAELWVYPSIPALIADGETLRDQGSRAHAHQNIVMVLPASLSSSSPLADSLTETLRQLP